MTRALATQLRALALRLEAEAASVRAQADALELAAPSDWVTFREARSITDASIGQWRDAIRGGALPGRKRGRAFVALRGDVEAWAAARLKTPTPPRVRTARVRAAVANDHDDEMTRALRRHA